jgi:hypothetical protein
VAPHDANSQFASSEGDTVLIKQVQKGKKKRTLTEPLFTDPSIIVEVTDNNRCSKDLQAKIH